MVKNTTWLKIKTFKVGKVSQGVIVPISIARSLGLTPGAYVNVLFSEVEHNDP